VTWQAEHWLWSLLAIPILVAGLVLWVVLARRAVRSWADPAVMGAGPRRRSLGMRAAAAAVAILAVAAGIVAMARPSVDDTRHERRSTVVIAIDTSLSMNKTDLQPSRRQAAVEAATRFVDAAPRTTAVGVVTFNDRTAVLLPPTTDRDRIHAALADLGRSREGTALGQAIDTSLSALRSSGALGGIPPADPSDSPGRILLLTDGANTVREGITPEAATQTATAERVPVYTIMLGDDPGFPGQPSPPETLAQIATETGGVFAQTVTTADLEAVFHDIGTIVAPVDALRELTVWAALAAIALLALATLLGALATPLRRRARGPTTA
jgi:Ca-activated chloride channel family protein